MLYVNPLAASPAFAATRTELGAARETQAVQEFERLFLFQLLREMRKSVPSDGLFGTSQQRQYVEEMLDDVWAGEMAKSGQLGIAAQIRSQLNVNPAQDPAGSPRMDSSPPATSR